MRFSLMFVNKYYSFVVIISNSNMTFVPPEELEERFGDYEPKQKPMSYIDKQNITSKFYDPRAGIPIRDVSRSAIVGGVLVD